MEHIDLISDIAEELEREEREAEAERQEFKERYELLIDCTVDELNDEILRLKLDDAKVTGTFMLVQDGKHMVYRGGVVSACIFTGGEEFTLKRVERGVDTGKEKSLINFIFKPIVVTPYSYLVLPYDKAIKYMDETFGAVIAKNLLPSMQETEKQVLELQREMAERHRQREIRLMQDAEGGVYANESSW
ncbi:hypothetical protein WKH82_08335 [Acinetobacter baumannii]|nr:hypothetical protein [Acinetobacter baumannii]